MLKIYFFLRYKFVSFVVFDRQTQYIFYDPHKKIFMHVNLWLAMLRFLFYDSKILGQTMLIFYDGNSYFFVGPVNIVASRKT